MKNRSKELIRLLKKHNLTIGSVESLTAGLFSSTLASVPVASNVLKGALITYQSSFKTSLLGISKSYIDKYDVVSKEVATMMAKKGKEILNTDIVISFTGNAGPTSEVGKAEVGRVYIAILCKPSKNKIINFTRVYKGNRNSIRSNVVSDAINLIIEHINVMFKNKVSHK